MRKFRNTKYVLFALSLVVWSGVLVAIARPALAAAPRCFSQDGQDHNRTEFFANNDTYCDYAKLQGSGYNMTGLPSPLQADKCYWWPADPLQPPQTISCTDPRVTGAVADDNSAAPPASIGNIPNTNTPPNDELTAFKNARCDSSSGQTTATSNCIIDRVNTFINLLSVGVGIVAIIMIIVGGIRYAAAGGDPQAVAKAKNHIRNALLALLGYLFLFAFLQWIVPGGIL
jgi:hypothetical protein